VAKLKVLCARSMHQVVGTLADGFRRTSGHEVEIDFATVGALAKKLDAGDRADVVISSTAAIDRLENADALVAGSRTDIATTRIGVAVRDGSTAPDISSPQAFRQALIAARAIAFSDAAVGGSAGVHLARLFVELGLADEIKRKGMPQQSGGEVAARVASGEADIGMTLIAEIVPVKGARVAGPLPPPLGNDAAYCAAVMRACGVPDAGRAFIATLTDPAHRKAWQAAGFDRPDGDRAG